MRCFRVLNRIESRKSKGFRLRSSLRQLKHRFIKELGTGKTRVRTTKNKFGSKDFVEEFTRD